MRALVTVSLALVANLGLTRAALFTDPAQLPADRRYDYVVIGAGPGGSVVASRLSEDPSTNVLLLEAGPSDEGVLAIQVPYLAYELQPNTIYDWNYTTTPQKGLDGRVVVYSRGRVLGGSSSINLMVWTRSSRDDFDRYASFTADDGWSWNGIEPYFRKIEHLVPPVDHHNTSGEVESQIHGGSGPVNISVANAPFPIDPHVNATTQELDDNFPYNEDMNSGDPIGIGWTQGTFGNGVRSSASSSYIRPVLPSRSNLDVLVNTIATKIITTEHDVDTREPVFSGVEVAQSSSSPTFTFKATKEVILSAGAINTPQLLMLSGIGPSSNLASLGIDVIVDNTAVGQHLADHPRVGNQFGVAAQEDDLNDVIRRNSTLFNDLLAEWETEKQGVMAGGGANHIGWLRIPKDDPLWKTEEDPSAGPTSPHYELLFTPGFASTIPGIPAPASGYFMSIYSVLVSPSSTGSLTLSSASPFDPPTIDPAFLNSSFDVYTMRAAIRAAGYFVSAPTWNGFIAGQAASFAAVDLNSNEAVDAWARSQASTIWHPTGTARMGRCGDRDSVVDADLRVKGARGLRVIDASVLPFIPAAHPQAVVYAFAERAADLIRSGRRAC